MAQLGPFEIGQIKAHVSHGMGGAAISRILFKPGGIKTWSEKCVQDAVKKLADNPDWRGERATGSGGPRCTTKKQDKAIEDYVLKWRGEEKVTVAVIRREHLWARKIS